MTKRENKFAKIKNNPKDVSIEELIAVLEWAGYKLVRIKGSHYRFNKPGCPPLTIPYNKPVKTVYVRLAIKDIEKYGNLDEERLDD